VNDTITTALAVGALVVLVSAVALRLADRLGLPSLLLYLALGLALGEGVLGIPFEDFDLARTLGVAALVVILAEGGLTTRWADVRRAAGPALALSTVGVLVSIGVTAAVTVWTLGLEWQFALLLGAVVSSTDAAAVFATLRRLPLPRRMVAALEVESGLNDAPVILLVVVLSGALTAPSRRPGGSRPSSSPPSSWAAPRSAWPPAPWELRCCAARRCRGPGSTRWPPWPCASSPSPRPTSRTPPASRPSTCAGSSSATSACRTVRRASVSPRGWRRWPRSASSCSWACSSRPTG